MATLPNLVFVAGVGVSTGTITPPNAGARWRHVRYQPFNGAGATVAAGLSGSEGGVALAEGLATVTGIGVAISHAVGASTGSAIVLGASTDTIIHEGAGASVGVATATAVGATVSTVASGVGLSAGRAIVTGQSSTFETAVTMGGTSTATFVGAVPVVARAYFTYTAIPAYLIVEID